MSRPNKRALGIATGDILTTSYNTGPYEVWDIQGPYLFSDSLGVSIYLHPRISVVLTEPGVVPPPGAHYPRINDIVQINGRWFSLGGRDEIYVEHWSPNGQLDMFGPDEPAAVPYAFQEGVNYQANAWHCNTCGRDFNAERTGRYCGPSCPDPRCWGLANPISLYPDRDWYREAVPA